MTVSIGPGWSIGAGWALGGTPVLLPVLTLDAANYSAVPVNGTTIAGTGGYTITTLNPGGSMTWSATNGGIFSKTADTDTDFLTFGPDYTATTQPYTVMMVYRSQPSSPGRLLNANSASPDWLAGLWGPGGTVQNIFFNGAFVGPNSDATDGNWQFIWATYNGDTITPTSDSYVANAAAPTTTYGSNSTNGGFDGLRLFGRYLNSTTSSEVPTADVGLVKVWDSVLTLPQIQAQWSAYKTRFGY
jgi:hypothetical protein